MTAINCAEIATRNNRDEGYFAGFRAWIAVIVAAMERIKLDFLPERKADFDGIGTRTMEKHAKAALQRRYGIIWHSEQQTRFQMHAR